MRHCRPTFFAPGISPRRHNSTTVFRGTFRTFASSLGVRTSPTPDPAVTTARTFRSRQTIERSLDLNVTRASPDV